jgi:hypothetical protein
LTGKTDRFLRFFAPKARAYFPYFLRYRGLQEADCRSRRSGIVPLLDDRLEPHRDLVLLVQELIRASAENHGAVAREMAALAVPRASCPHHSDALRSLGLAQILRQNRALRRHISDQALGVCGLIRCLRGRIEPGRGGELKTN